MKRRTLTLTLCILACIALIGVGFASWVITYNKKAEVTGNVDIDTISDKSHVVTVTSGAGQSVVFGAKAVSSTTPKTWLTLGKSDSGEDDATENLVLTYTVKVTNWNDLVTGKEFIVTVEEVKGSDDATPYASAVTSELVASLPSQTDSDATNKIKIENTETDGEYKVTITFNWGTYFNGKNPTDFYNENEATAVRTDAKSIEGKETVTYMEDALNVIKNLDAYKNLKSASFKVTINPNVSSSEGDK